MKVLVVDDSVTFRSAIKAALSGQSDIEVSGTAANGKIALSKLQDGPFDLMILDLEMPDMDGLETLQAMKERGIVVQTLIFAAPTAENYKKVSMALKLGATDFLAKPSGSNAAGDINAAIESIRAEILPKLRSLASHKQSPRGDAAGASPGHGSSGTAQERRPSPAPSAVTWSKRELLGFTPQAVVIASSTGGPIALENLFARVQGPTRVPIFVIQHMPPPFTKGLASRIEEITQVRCAEGIEGEQVVANRIYVSPADFHMSLKVVNGATRITIAQGPQINFVRPAADPLFSSAATIYRGGLMAFVLTGMGEDGKVGACDVKRGGGGVMIQDEASSVVWGMPGAVFQAGAYDAIGAVDECGVVLRRMVTL